MKPFRYRLYKHHGSVSYFKDSQFDYVILSSSILNSNVAASFAHIAHPIGSLLSGPVCDKFGRRNTILMVTIPLTMSWLVLGFADSFPIICICFAAIGFCMGLKESPSITYVLSWDNVGDSRHKKRFSFLLFFFYRYVSEIR